jgi:hypothetical protein
MQQLIKGALAQGYSRAQAYQLVAAAIEVKKQKVFKQLMLLRKSQITWSQLESIIRKYQLSQAQYKQLKARYYQYSWD